MEPNDRYPMNADYFRKHGYLVTEREYGTRVYKEMFTITNSDGDAMIEIRRNPASGGSSFAGLVEQSSHIRLTNWMLYQGNPVDFLRDFLLTNEYIFKRIYRIDICYDFEFFDYGDLPARFVRRYLKGEYRKINQCGITMHGKDSWESCDINSLSWGSPSSMVSTKLYNKSLELKQAKNDKPWIKTCWLLHGLIDNPCSMTKRDTNGNLYTPDIWRVEFSMKSEAEGWCVIEMQNGKKVKQQAIPHRLEQFDAKDKIWKRFQDLAYHYFHFKHRDYIGAQNGIAYNALLSLNSELERKPQRKDRCRDKVLFRFDERHEFAQLVNAPSASKKSHTDEILRRRLLQYRVEHPQPNIRTACDELLKNIERLDSLRFVPLGDDVERRAWQITLQRKLNCDERTALEIMQEVKNLLLNKEIF